MARRNNEEPVTYFHPDLKPVLERTLGVPLFQEQMLQIAMIMADFDGNEADELRRSISFKRNNDRMNRVVAKLRTNMTRKGVAAEVQEKIVNSLGSFALYGFPESHAISFALLAYASCWLKVHRPSEFYCALLNNQPMGFYSPGTLMQDGQRRGIRFRSVCAVLSEERCVIETEGSIRLGLNYVQGLHIDSARRLVEERKRDAFKDLHDLLLRVGLNKAERRVLAKIGAFNKLAKDRRTALWQVEGRFDEADLFTEKVGNGDKIRAPLIPMNSLERLHADYDGMRVTTGAHPMTFLRERCPHATLAANVKQLSAGKTVTIAGLVICRQRPGTANGHVFISLEDETGIANAFVRSELFEENRLLITHEPFLEIEGLLQNMHEVVSILARKIRPISGALALENQSHDFH